MTDLSSLPLHYPDESGPTRNGAVGKRCRRHRRQAVHFCTDPGGVGFWHVVQDDSGRNCEPGIICTACWKRIDSAASRRGRNNRSRGNRAELDVARLIPGSRKMGPLGLPWDVEVGTYARLQVKRLAKLPSANAIVALIRAIPATGDRLRGFVWVSAPGKGHVAEHVVWFLAREFEDWHGTDFRRTAPLVSMPLETWVTEFVAAEADR